MNGEPDPKAHDKRQPLIAVTGASGFVGANLLALCLEKGAAIRALARSPAKLSHWADRIDIIHGDLDSAAALDRLAAGADAFIHGAGLTFARRDADYARVNADGAAAAAKAARSSGARFVHLSSLSARMPALSAYARSKADAEDRITALYRREKAAGDQPRHDCVMLRLPAIYGPHDVATLPYFQLIARGLALEPATREPARASIGYVADVAEAIWTAAAGPVPSGLYEVGDDKADGHSWREIGQTLAGVLGRKAHALRLPKGVVRLYHRLAMAAAAFRGATPSARTGQANEFFHPDWVARERLFRDHAPWAPTHTLAEGFAKTARWYQEQGCLRRR